MSHPTTALSVAEPLLQGDPNRFTIFPIAYPDIWDMYKKALSSFWITEEVDLSKDMVDWQTLTEHEQQFIKLILAFFAVSDGIVVDNLVQRFSQEVKVTEANYFYGLQVAMENIHSEMYSLLIASLISDESEQQRLFDALENFPCIAKKANWAQQWIDSKEASFAERLVAFAVVEGIFFSGSFAAIFWLRKRALMPGLGYSNELISRDEGLHCEFACLLYKKYITNKLTAQRILDIVDSGVKVEQAFLAEALKHPLGDMNQEAMNQYIEFCADRLIRELGYANHYHAENPFDFISMMAIEAKTNFFERRVSEYKKFSINAKEVVKLSRLPAGKLNLAADF